MKPLISANINENLSMNKYHDFFSDKSPEQVNAYKSAQNMIDTLKGSEADAALKEFYFKAYDVGSPEFNMTTLESHLNSFSDMMSTGQGQAFAMDLETLGGTLSPTEKNMFAITEMAISKMDIATGAITDTQNVLFGINQSQAAAYDELVSRAQFGYNNLTATERSTLERLSRYGSANTKITMMNGRPVITNLGAGNPMDLSAARKGIQNLRQYSGFAFGTEYAKQQLGIASNHLNSIKGASNMLFTHNGTKFDLPVLNEAMKMHGIAQVANDISHIDFQSAIHTAYAGNMLDFHLNARETTGVGGPVKGSLETLEKISESFGINTTGTAHVAANDTKALLQILGKNFKQGMPVYKDITERINAYSRIAGFESIDSNNAANKRIFVKNAVQTTGLDYIKSNTGIKSYGDWLLSRNNFYTVEGFGYISPESIAKTPDLVTAMNVVDGTMNEGMYYMTLKNASQQAGQGETVTLVRKTKEEFQALFQKNLDVYNFVDNINQDPKSMIMNKAVNQGIIESNTHLALADNARRKFEGMFQTSGKGFNYAEAMYSTFNNINANGPVTAADAARMLESNPTSDMFKGLMFNGQIIAERKHDFLAMYDTLKDTSGTMTTAINTIKSNTMGLASKEADVKRTVALSNVFGSLQQQMKDLGVAENIALNKKLIQPYPVDIDVISLGFDEQNKFTVRTRSVNEARVNILNNIDKMVGSERGKKARERKRLFYLKELAKNVYKNEPEKVDRMFTNLTSSHYVANEIAGDLHGKFMSGNLDAMREPIYATSLKGYQIGGASFDDFIRSSGIDVYESINRSLANVNGVFSLNSNSVGFNGGMFQLTDDAVKGVMLGEYGYTEQNVHDFLRGLYGSDYKKNPYGLVNANNLAVEVFLDNDKQLAIAITSPQKATKMFEEISKGLQVTEAIVSRLPKVNLYQTPDNLGGIRIASFGGVEKEITSELNSYYTKDVSSNYFNNIRVINRDIISESLAATTKLHFQLPDLVANREWERGSRLLSNAVASPIFGASGFSGYSTVEEGGRFMKKLLPNASDVITSSSVNLQGLVNFIPEIYERDAKVQEALNKLFVGYKAIDAKFINQWKQDIMAGQLKTFGEMGIEFQEWFAVNMFDGHKLINQVRDLKALDGKTFQKEVDMLDSIIKGGASFLNKAEKVSEGIAVLKNPFEYSTYGFLNELSRPVARQSMAFHAIEPGKVAGLIPELESRGMKLGQTVVTEEFYKDYLTKYQLESGVTGNVLNANQGEILKRIEEARPGLQALESKYGAEAVDKVTRELQMIGDTYQQHSLINPMLTNKLWNQPELININAKNFEFADGINVGTKVKNKQVIGYEILDDGKRRAVINHAQDSIIADSQLNKVTLKPISAQVDEIKIILGNVEKSVASTMNRELAMAQVTQDVWDTVFGRDIAVVGRFEIGKHEAASIAYGSSINKFAERAIQQGSEGRALFQNAMSTALPSWAGRFEGDRFIIAGNPAAEGGHIAGIHKMVDSLQASDTRGIFNDLINEFKTGTTNTFRTIISKGQMSEMFSTMGEEGELGGKGFKVGEREFQIAGIRTGENIEDFYTKDAQGKYKKKLQPVLDLWRSEISQEAIVTDSGKEIATNYGKAKKDLRNIASVYEILGGKDTAAAVKTVNFTDIQAVLKGVDAASLSEALRGTAFEEGVDVFKILLPNNIKVLNPLTNIPEANIVLPFLHSYDIDGKVILHDAHKKTINLIRQLDQITEGKLPGGVTNINQVQGMLNQTYMEAIAAYGAEFSDDKGSILRSHLMSGRLTHSGQGLVGAVVSPTTIDMAMGKVLHPGLDKDIISTVGGKTMLKDVAYTSEEMMTAMGVNFEAIGRQVVGDPKITREIADVDAFLRRIKGLSTTQIQTFIAKDLELIGKQFAKEVGIYGTMLRYPSFLQTSMAVTNFRLNESLHGYKFNIMSWTAAGLNADVDADRISSWMNLNKDGGIKASNDVTQKSLLDVFHAQGINNRPLYDAAMEDYNKVSAVTHTPGGYEAYLREKIAPKLGIVEGSGDVLTVMDQASNNLRNETRRMTATKANIDKAAIGYISNPNVHIRDIALAHFGAEGDIENLKNILEMTDKTEQKIIDVKHVKNFDDAIVQANRYMKAVNSIAKGKPEEVEAGINQLKEIMYKTGVYDRAVGADVARVEAIGGSLKALSGKLSEQWSNPLRSKMSGGKIGQYIKDVAQIVGGAAFGGTELTNAAMSVIESVKDVQELNIGGTVLKGYQSAIRAGENYPVLIKQVAKGVAPTPIGAYVFAGLGTGEITGQKYAELHEYVDTSRPNKHPGEYRKYRVYGDSYKDVQAILANEFNVADDLNDMQKLIDIEKARITDSAMSGGFDFERERVTAEYISKMDTVPEQNRSGLINDILNRSSLDTTNRDLVKGLEQMTPTPFQREAYKQLQGEFFENEKLGKPMRKFAAAAQELAKDNYVGNPGNLIRGFNQRIREAGKNPNFSSSQITDLHNELIRGQLSRVPGLASGQIDNILGNINARTDSVLGGSLKLQAGVTQDMTSVIAQIQSTPLYNMRQVHSDLLTRAQDEIAGITDAQAREAAAGMSGLTEAQQIEYGKRKIAETITRSNVQAPFETLARQEAMKVESLGSAYSKLVSSNSAEARNFLGWGPADERLNMENPRYYENRGGPAVNIADSIKQLGESRVTYGSYIGSKMSDLSIDELKELQRISPAMGRSSEEIENITQLKNRVNQYFNAMDVHKSELPSSFGNILPDRTSRYATADVDSLLRNSNVKLQNTDEILETLKRTMTPNLVRGTIEEGTEAAIRETESLLGHGTGMGKVVLAGVALGLAGVMIGQMSARPGPLQPEHKNQGGGGAPDAQGNYEQQGGGPQVQYKNPAPVIPKKTYMEPNNGMKINISAKNRSRLSNDQVANTVNNAIQNSLPNQMNVNVVSKDDTQNIDDGWLEEQFKRLLSK